MSCYARYAYLNRSEDNKCRIEGFLEPEYIPECCDMGGDFENDSKSGSERPDVYALLQVKGKGNRIADLVFCADKGVEEIYTEAPIIQGDYVFCVQRAVLLKCESVAKEACSSYYAFSKTTKDGIDYTVGEMNIFLKTMNATVIVRVHLFWEDMELYRGMITELSEMSTSLIRSWTGSYTRIENQTDNDDTGAFSFKETKDPSASKRYIDTPEDAEMFLAELEKRIVAVQQHAETDLQQVYKKMPFRKAKRITPKTLIEYSCTKNRQAKVNVLSTEEHYDLYEHRMIRQYLLDLQDYFRRKIEISEYREEDLKNQEKRVEENKSQIECSLRKEGFYNATERLSTKSDTVKADLEKEQKKENEQQKKWEQNIGRIDELLTEYPVLNVDLHGEKLHSSMLFMRNRYYRSLYELINGTPMINVYRNINAMPTQKLYTLYEIWCYFKMISIIMETYGFEIYAFKTEQGKLNKENRVPAQSLVTLIQSSISDMPYSSENYICMVLKKKDFDDQYIKLEYQRVFGEPGSMEPAKKVIPDFCITFGKIQEGEGCFDIAGQTYLLDSKYKKYYKEKFFDDLFFVSWFKYVRKLRELSIDTDVEIRGSFILYPYGTNGSLGWEKFGEQYGANIDNYLNLYKRWLNDGVEERKNVSELENEYCELLEEDGKGLEKGLREDCKKMANGRIKTRIGGFCFSIKDNTRIRRLFRMILEWNKPFGYNDETHLLVWKTCLVCGQEIENEDITTGVTERGYIKYHIMCSKCGEFWVKTHCGNHRVKPPDLIKHLDYTNYLEQTDRWYVKCPICGH